MKILLMALLAVAFSASPIFAGHCATHSHKAAKFPDISYEKLSKLVKAKEVVLLDANGTSSFKKAHIPGAMDFSSMDSKALAKALPKDKNALIVAYCGGSYCGAWKKAAEKAKALGYTNIAHFSAGISGWKKSTM